MKKFYSKVALVAMALLASVAFAGTTGSINGTITDSNNDPLPGVTIVMTSPNLIGSRTSVTDANGNFRAVFLPPGPYEVTATFTGFRTEKAPVRVEIDGNHSVNLKLEAANSVEEDMVVTADLPVIDQRTTESGGNFNEDFFTKVATGRQVTDVMTLAPGVSSKDVDGSYRINGASGPENQYIMDGVNTTGIERGDSSSNLNFDFVQEVQVKTGGYSAEFGRATGGILNVITKSGGNEFEGSVYAFSDRRNSVASPEHVGANGSTSLGNDKTDYGITVGGPIIKDKLWFFAGANPQSDDRYKVTPADRINSADNRDTNLTDTRSWVDVRGETETLDLEQSYFVWAAKLTWQLNESNNFTFSANGDPGDYISRDQSGTISSDTKTDSETKNYIVKWNSILSNVFTLDASYGKHDEVYTQTSVDGQNISNIFHRFSDPQHNVGGIGFVTDTDATRDDFNIKVGAFLGNHDLKAGIQYEETTFGNTRTYSGLGSVRYDPFFRRLRVRTFADVNDNPQTVQSATTDNEYNAYFIQDSWSVTPNIILNLGVRNEVQKLLDSTGNTYHKFDDNLAPRLGFTWDFLGDGRSKLYGNYGRFVQSIPMDINNRAAAPEILLFRTYAMLPDSPDNILNWNEAEVNRVIQNGTLLGVSGFGSGATPIDPNTKATNHDEIILGVEYEFKTDWTFGFKYVGRKLNDAIEDLSFDAGNNYIIGNPGRDLTFTNHNGGPLEFFDYNGDFVSVADGETYTLTADRIGFPKPKRDYNGYEFLLRKNYRDDYQFQFTYVHSAARGNYDGSTVASGQVDPGITALFDIPSTTVNGDGFLPQHRRHQFKFNGSYDFDFGLTSGLTYTYTSGAGIDALGDPDVGNGAYSDFHLVKRGTAGSLPGLSSVDVHLDYNMKFSGKMNLSLYADVFNVFNFQEATAVERTYNDAVVDAADPNGPWNDGLPEINTGDGDADAVLYGNRYYSWVEGRFHNTNEIAAATYLDGTAIYGGPQSSYGRATDFQLGRRTRFGVRFRF